MVLEGERLQLQVGNRCCPAGDWVGDVGWAGRGGDGGRDGSGGLVEPGLHIVEEGDLLLGCSNGRKAQEQRRGAHIGIRDIVRPLGMRNVEFICLEVWVCYDGNVQLSHVRPNGGETWD